MKAISIFLLFLGTILVLQGYYDQKTSQVCAQAQPEIKLVPMSIYEQQMKPEESLSQFYKSMFESTLIWPPLSLPKAAMEDALAPIPITGMAPIPATELRPTIQVS